MKKLFPTMGLLLAIGAACPDAMAQTYMYDFGTGTGSHTTAASTTFLPAPPAGGGTARVRVGTGGASFSLENPGNTTFGSGTELRMQAPTGGSAAKFSIYGFTNTTPYVSVRSKLLIDATASQEGELYFFIGNGTNFSDNGTFTSSQQFTGFMMELSNTDTIWVSLRTAGGWAPSGFLLKQEEYLIEVIGNNDVAATPAAGYTHCGMANTVAAGTLDLWINGNLVGDDLPKGLLPAGTSPNSFMLYAINAPSPSFNTIIDDISYTAGLASTAAVTASATGTNPTTVGGSDGSATVSVSTGTAPYSYTWSPSGGSAATATGLSAGTYSVTVTDANGCSATETVTLSDPTSNPLSVAITSSTNVNCYGQATGSATAEAAGGTAPYSYTWSPSGGNAATATGLTAGVYTVTVTDANSATATETVSIGQPATAVSASIATQTNPVCNGQANGSAFVLPFGGTPAYTYSWSTSSVQTTAVATGLSAGAYTVTVTDNNGCEAIAVATLTDPAAVVATASSNSPVTSGSTIMLEATGGTSYSWTGPDNFSSLLQNPEITNATAANDGTYSVTVTNASGCSATATTTVTVNAPATGNFTIDQTSPATATNFISLASAADYFNTTGVTMPTVVTVVTGTGPYAGQLLLNEIPGSSATNTLTINGNGNEVNHCSTDPMNRDIIRLNGTDNVIIDGFVLNATCSQGWGVHVMGDAENVTISDNTINLSAPYSIYAGNMNGIIAGNSFTDPAAMGGTMSNLTISGNEINNGYHAIRINGNATNNATNVDIVENVLNDATVFGIILSYGQDIAINDNDVFMFDAAAGKVISSKGIYIVAVENGISVQRNRVANAGHMGLWLNYVNRASTTRGTVANNMIGGGFRNNNAIAVQLNSASHLDFYYNSINTDFGTTGVGLYVSNRHSVDLNVVNNSFAYTGGAGGRALQAGDAFYNFNTIDYNNYFSNGTYFVYFNRGFRANLAALQASTEHGVGTHDMNSIEANPMYQSPTDLNILMTSPLVGEGTPLASVTTDVYGTTRHPQTPAIGAHEPMVGPLRQAAFSNQVEVYPNPFGNEFRVRAAYLNGSVQIVLTDMMGRQVYNRALSASPELTIQPQVNLPQGIYLLEVTNNGTTTQHRVVKQ